MDERKGFRFLFNAYPAIKRKFPKARLLVVGAYRPEEVADFQRASGGRDRKDIHFIGKVSREELRSYYRTATVYCSPATGAESFGIVLLEAMASGVPIVASNIAGYRSVLTHDREGWLVEPGNEKAIAEAVIRLLGQSDKRKTMAAQGQRTAKQYDWKGIAPRILDYYMELIKVRALRNQRTVYVKKELDLAGKAVK
jgi:phosphatidylinositol alpha-mannosyltransferase